jgi:hypothetical protein
MHPQTKGTVPMNRTMSHLIGVVCAVLCLGVFSGRAAGAVRPYAASGTAHFVSQTEFVGSGFATHLGRYSEEGIVAFSPTSNPAVLGVEGSIVYTAANGDELHADVTGELNTQTGVIAATVTYDGGTGRFATASSSSTLAGQMLPSGTISVTVSGTIDY